jgi:hypothetical protein
MQERVPTGLGSSAQRNCPPPNPGSPPQSGVPPNRVKVWDLGRSLKTRATQKRTMVAGIVVGGMMAAAAVPAAVGAGAGLAANGIVLNGAGQAVFAANGMFASNAAVAAAGAAGAAGGTGGAVVAEPEEQPLD